LSFGFVSAQLQGYSNLRLRQRPMIGTPRQNSKILAPNGHSISSNALENQGRDVKGGIGKSAKAESGNAGRIKNQGSSP
jgi:hypothetical protein